jgi:ubiquinone/menaquinone biosynthesis C-methylase UbiE
VLLLGPLYYLIFGRDRRQALAEASRVVRPRGILFAVSVLMIPRGVYSRRPLIAGACRL